MGGTADWEAIRRDYAAGSTAETLGEAYGVSPKTISARAGREDWRGLNAQRRRRRLVDMLLDAAERVVSAESAADAERRAKALAAVTGVAKAVREFDPQLAAPEPGGEDPEQMRAMRAEFDAEVERLIEERVAERVRATSGDF